MKKKMNFSAKSIINQLAKKIVNEKTAFFVGAGISLDSGAPSGKSIVHGVVDGLFEGKNHIWPEGIDDEKSWQELKDICIEKSRPETLFNHIEICAEKSMRPEEIPVIDELFSFMNQLEPSFVHFLLGYWVQQGLVKHILCLNYDRLIEIACKDRRCELDVYHTGEDYAKLAKEGYSNSPGIYKFHGSLLEDNAEKAEKSIDVIEDNEQKESLQMAIKHIIPFDPNKATCIKWFMENRSIVFLGCSGSDDFDLTPIFMAHEATHSFYWIHYQEDEGVDNIQVLDFNEDMLALWKKKKNPLFKPGNIILNQNKMKKQKDIRKESHYLIGANTRTFLKELCKATDTLNNSKEEPFEPFEKRNPIIQNELFSPDFENILSTWMGNIPSEVKDLALALLLLDYGFRQESLKLFLHLTNKQKNIAPSIYYEAQIVKGRTLHEIRKFKEALDTFTALESALNSPVDQMHAEFLCRTFKRRGFLYRDMASGKKNEEERNRYLNLAEKMFQRWEETLTAKKELFKDPDDYNSFFYESQRDKAWVLRDKGMLQEALDLMKLCRFPDLYNQAKVNIDAGWFALDEAKRRYFKKLDKYDEFIRKAKSYFETAIDYAEKGAYLDIKAQCYRSLPNVYAFEALLINSGKKEDENIKESLRKKAHDSLKKSLELFEQLGVENEKAIAMQEEALHYYAFGNKKKAEEEIDKAVQELEKSQDISRLEKARKIQYDIKHKHYVIHFIEMLDHLFV
jgi:NAD-dependent SIR2 family protein deacetylase